MYRQEAGSVNFSDDSSHISTSAVESKLIDSLVKSRILQRTAKERQAVGAQM